MVEVNRYLFLHTAGYDMFYQGSAAVHKKYLDYYLRSRIL